MSRDVNLAWDDDQNVLDIVFENGDIASDRTITSPALTQIFTRSRLENYEQQNKFMQQGWVGSIFSEGFIAGCKFEHVISQGNLTQDNINSAVNEIKKALQFLLDLGVVEKIDADISTNPIEETLTLSIIIIEKTGQNTLIVQEIRL